jgi:hypothetical protein
MFKLVKYTEYKGGKFKGSGNITKRWKGFTITSNKKLCIIFERKLGKTNELKKYYSKS